LNVDQEFNANQASERQENFRNSLHKLPSQAPS
jgi:hypothetical protein